ncbi:hypothetical protein JSQ81_17885 [Sporosarcina sp. Marseille-Q4063]|uniref:hypothetical protein n=1 Tax=Sporosarcina sp. Marseille-Q4063 TaxID=2810514 RepID=UPI001BAF0FC3|nr:hypothetical protein [Sporosarcina sp. Marseille-Q4063]QUW21637.1 hypothetical protein JSQ81_17885 [Sporosarcina sp. Marseille-Q4063]
MDQKQAFAQMQNLMSLNGDNGDDFLGGLVIFSAVFTEFALADILFAEGDKIRAAIDTASPAQLAEINNAVARVLDQICCIEKRVVEKIELGIDLRNGNGYGAA